MYEVIPKYWHCHVYLDLEYCRRHNVRDATADAHMLTTFIASLQSKWWQWNLSEYCYQGASGCLGIYNKLYCGDDNATAHARGKGCANNRKRHGAGRRQHCTKPGSVQQLADNSESPEAKWKGKSRHEYKLNYLVQYCGFLELMKSTIVVDRHSKRQKLQHCDVEYWGNFMCNCAAKSAIEDGTKLVIC